MIEKEKGEYLVIDYLTGSISPESLEQLKQWLKEDDANRAYFAEMREVWFSAACDADYEYDTTAAYEEFLSRIEAINEHRNRSWWQRSRRFYLKIAAVAACVALVGIVSFVSGRESFSQPSLDIVVEVPFGSHSTMFLPDSTEVNLNAGSRLVYSQSYGVSNRYVRLEGEAYFTVKHDEKLPFVVRTRNIDVYDIGTKFNLRNYHDDDEAVVTLLEGCVEVALSGKTPEKTLVPNQRLLYDKTTGHMKIDNIEAANASQWVNGYLFFDEELITDIMKSLERNYNVNICIARDSVKSQRIYGNFTRDEQTIEEIIKNICTVSGISYSIKGKEITLY